MSKPSQEYAVFLCHNSEDKAVVRNINEALRQEYNLRTFLDESRLVAGEEWERSIQAAMSESGSCAIMLGPNGWGGYQLSGEAKPALARRSRDPTFRVIPVLLPGARPEELLDLREFFVRTHWVAFRNAGDPLAIRALASAISGENPLPEGRPELTPMRISFDSIRWDVSARRDTSVLYVGKQLREASSLLSDRPLEFTDLDLARAFVSAGERRQDEDLGRTLAAHAGALFNSPSQRELAANLALEAIRRFPSPEAHGVLRSTQTLLPRAVARFDHPAPVSAVATDRAERWLVIGCADGSVSRWDGQQLALARWKHDGTVRAVLFDPDGGWVATGSDDGTIAVWDLDRLEPRAHLSHGEPVTRLDARARAEGTVLLSSSGEPGHSGKVALWSAAEWQEAWSGGAVMDAALDSNGTHVMLAWGDHVAVRSASDGALVAKHPLGATVITIATHPVQPLIAATTFTRQIWIGTFTEAIEMKAWSDSISPAGRVRFSPDGRWLAAVGDDFRIRIWDVETQHEQAVPYEGLLGVDFGFSPHDSFLSIASDEAKSVTLWHVPSRQQLCVLRRDNPSAIAFSDDERLVITASAGTSAEMLEMPRGDEALWSAGLGQTRSLTFSPDGRWLAWTGRRIEGDLRVIGPPALVVLEGRSADVALSAELADEALEAVFDPDGLEIAVFEG